MFHPRLVSPTATLMAAHAEGGATPAVAHKVLVCVGNDGIPDEVMSELLARRAAGASDEVLLVAVWEPTESSVGGDQFHRSLAPQVLNCVKRNTETYLSAVAEDLSRHGISAEPHVLMGYHARDIRSLAAHQGAELLTGGRDQPLSTTCVPARRLWCQGPCPIGF